MQPMLDGSVLLLSAAFEQFVADVMVSYSMRLPSIYRAYSDLPDPIQRANVRCTGEALRNGDAGFDAPERQRFVENLNACLSGDEPYTLNGVAIAFNRRNMTANRLRELIGLLGVSNIWNVMPSTRAMKDWSPQDSAASARQRARAQLDSLIEERNQIAHKVGNTAPGYTVVRSYLMSTRAIAKALVESLEIVSALRVTDEMYRSICRRPGPMIAR